MSKSVAKAYTVSQMKDFIKCPQYAYNIHELRRIREGRSSTLDIGTLFHECMEQKIAGDEIIGTECPSWAIVEQETKDLWDKHKLWIPIDEFQIPSGWEIRGAEVVLEGTINGIPVKGKLDAPIKYNGKFWSGQWKTYTDDLQELIEKVRLGWHECVYQELARQNGMEPWGGTILGACAKLPGYRMIVEPVGESGHLNRRIRYNITDADRAAAFTTHYISRPPAVQHRMLADFAYYLMRKNGMDRGMFNPARNYDSCWNLWGKRCPYHSVCHEGADINGSEFVTVEERY